MFIFFEDITAQPGCKNLNKSIIRVYHSYKIGRIYEKLKSTEYLKINNKKIDSSSDFPFIDLIYLNKIDTFLIETNDVKVLLIVNSLPENKQLLINKLPLKSGTYRINDIDSIIIKNKFVDNLNECFYDLTPKKWDEYYINKFINKYPKFKNNNKKK